MASFNIAAPSTEPRAPVVTAAAASAVVEAAGGERAAFEEARGRLFARVCAQ